MRRGSTSVALVVLIACAAETTAQDHPDFSGHWTLDAPAGRGRGGPPPSVGSGWGPSFTITQRSDSLIVERPFFSPGDLQPPLKYRYSLLGSVSVNEVLMGRGVQRHSSIAGWDEGRLVITTTHRDELADRGRGVTSEVRYTLSLQRAPREAHPPLLVIETRREGVMGGSSTTVRAVYVRS